MRRPRTGSAAVLLAAWHWRRRKHAFPSQPGHWLLVAQGIIWGTILTLVVTASLLPSPSALAEACEPLFALAMVVAVLGGVAVLVGVDAGVYVGSGVRVRVPI